MKMDFDFTPEQLAIRKHMRDFAEREIAPKAAGNDRACKFDWDIAKKYSPKASWAARCRRNTAVWAWTTSPTGL